jgi:transmembrane sensor
MNMTRDQYLLLYEKYLNGEATPEEQKTLLLYQDHFELETHDTGDDSAKYAEVKQRILKRLNQSTRERSVILPGRVWWSAAAVLIIVSAALSLFHHKPDVRPVAIRQSVIKQDIRPGKNSATLTLANGKAISLNNAANGTISQQGNITVKKKKDGMLEYVMAQGSSSSKPVINTISTPRGGQYQLVLPDGTAVWLNAASSLQFPSSFTGKDRIVELTGEAYFEVAKNKKMPFKVKFNNTEIEVLGTHFDIKSYDDEETNATLMEGSIKIRKNNQEKILLPGQQATVSGKTGNLNVVQANTQEALAWKNGLFMFHNASIKSIMKTAARWYDVDVNYIGRQNENEYGGKISKYKNISELLKNLELTGTVRFKVEGRRVTVIE